VAYSTHEVGQDVVVTDLMSGRRERLASSAADGSPDIRPDGGAVVFSSDRGGARELWVQPLVEGRPVGRPRQLTTGVGRAAVPSFSADGELVAFYRIVGNHRELWVVPANGGRAVRLTEGAWNDLDPSFSPDGRCLAFTRESAGVAEIWSIEVATGGGAGPARRLTAGVDDASFTAWSPRGDRLAFLDHGDVWIADVPGCPEAETAPRPGTRLTRGAEALDLAWIEEGTALLVSGTWGGDRLELRRVAAHAPSDTPQLVLEIGDPRGEGTFGVSRDGRFVTTISAETRGDIWVARVVEP
jgi:Tol biopolymer transport system component